MLQYIVIVHAVDAHANIFVKEIFLQNLWNFYPIKLAGYVIVDTSVQC